MATTATELGYVHGVTSNIQTQLNSKPHINDVPSAGVKNGLDSFEDLSNDKSFIGSVLLNTEINNWHHVLSIRHRNGLNDGRNYGIYIRNKFGDKNLYWAAQDAGSWSEEKTILDSGNYSDYTVTKTGDGASGTWPISISGNSDTVDNWHGVGTTGLVLKKSGYVTSDVADLSSYWCRLASIGHAWWQDDSDITIYLHSAYNKRWGIVCIRSRKNSEGSITAACQILAGNLDTSYIRLYYDASSLGTKTELWYNTVGLYGVMNALVLSETSRTAQERNLVELYTTSFTEAQTLPDMPYIEAEYMTIGNSTTGNAASATKLATARTLWGQSFDGTQNVSGTLTNVPSIINQEYYHRLDLGRASSNQWDFYEYGGAFNFYKNTVGTQEGAVKIFSILGDKVGIGNVTPTYNLHVAGNGYFSSSLSLGSTLTAQGLATLNGGVKTNIITLVNGDKTANISLDADENIHVTDGLYSDSWRKILDSKNYRDYTVTKTGEGASGT